MFINNLKRTSLFRSSAVTTTRYFSSNEEFKSNIPQSIWDMTQRKLLSEPKHPLSTITSMTTDLF